MCYGFKILMGEKALEKSKEIVLVSMYKLLKVYRVRHFNNLFHYMKNLFLSFLLFFSLMLLFQQQCYCSNSSVRVAEL